MPSGLEQPLHLLDATEAWSRRVCTRGQVFAIGSGHGAHPLAFGVRHVRVADLPLDDRLELTPRRNASRKKRRPRPSTAARTRPNGGSPDAMSTHATATSTAPRPRAALAQSITTGPLGPTITFQGMEVEVDEAIALAARRRRNPRRCCDRVKATVEVGERRALGPQRPRPATHQGDHRRTLDALHHDPGADVGDLLDRGHGIAVRARDRGGSGAEPASARPRRCRCRGRTR